MRPEKGLREFGFRFAEVSRGDGCEAEDHCIIAPVPAIPLYSTAGDWAGLFENGHLFNPLGEWIGWVTDGNQVYSVTGEYVGWLSKDFRILRKRTYDEPPPRRKPPPAPPRPRVPATVPLPPLMAELGFDVLDVFEDMPERLHSLDYIEETRPDMD